MDESCPTSAWVMSHTWMHHNATTRWWRSHCTYSLMENSRPMFQHVGGLNVGCCTSLCCCCPDEVSLITLYSIKVAPTHVHYSQSQGLDEKSPVFYPKKTVTPHTHIHTRTHLKTCLRCCCPDKAFSRYSSPCIVSWLSCAFAPVLHTNESWHIYEWLTYKWVMTQIWMTHACVLHPRTLYIMYLYTLCYT